MAIHHFKSYDKTFDFILFFGAKLKLVFCFVFYFVFLELNLSV